MNHGKLKRIFATLLVALVIASFAVLPSFAEFIEWDFSQTFKEDAMAACPMLVGIDVSSYQGVIDWAKVKEAGVDFAMIRMYSHVADKPEYTLDQQFEANVAGAREQGIHIGAYFFSYARNLDDVTNEANMVVAELNKYPGVFSFPIVFDAEEGDSKDGFDITSFAGDACQTFCRILEENGYYAMVYANTNWLKNIIDHTKISEYSIWQANYFYRYEGYTPSQSLTVESSSRPAITHNNENVFMWQFTDSGSVSGISGGVDMNVTYRDFSRIIIEGGFNGYEKQGEGHVCSFDTATYDSLSHYNRCACGAIQENSLQTHNLNLSTTDLQHTYSCDCGYLNTKDHVFDKFHTDDEYHYGMCVCGYISEESKSLHVLQLSTTEEQHTYSCECGFVDVSHSGEHVFDRMYAEDEFHYEMCICGYIDETSKTEHVFDKEGFDKLGHYTECVCGYKVEIPHSYGEYLYNEAGHWQKCECGYETVAAEHSMSESKCTLCEYHIHGEDVEWAYDADAHWPICELCVEPAKEEHLMENCECAYCGYSVHEYEFVSDCEFHRNVCKNCGHERDKTEHKFSENVCFECGSYGHIYVSENNAESHWRRCITCENVIDEEVHILVDGTCECGYVEEKMPESDTKTETETESETKKSDETDETKQSEVTVPEASETENETESSVGSDTESGNNNESAGCKSSFGGFGICMAVACVSFLPVLKKKKK